jgi:C-terminal processing protease CtpA/Prc
MQMIGDHCSVIRVRPQSDAESKGLKPGDEVLSINGFTPNRDVFWKMMYVNKILRPKPSIQLDLRSPSGTQRHLDITAKMESKGTQVKDLMYSINDLIRESEDNYLLGRPRWVEVGDLIIIKIPQFSFSDSEAGDLIGKARKHKALILDLRSNGGGAEDSLKALLGLLFDHDITIADRVRRSDRKTLVAKSRHDAYTDRLAVLVDSSSASASELFARIVQLEKARDGVWRP